MLGRLALRQRRTLLPSRLEIRNIVVRGSRTSIRIEPELWEALQEIVDMQGVTLNQLVTQIDRRRTAMNLTSAIRAYIVDFYRRSYWSAITGAPADAQTTDQSL